MLGLLAAATVALTAAPAMPAEGSAAAPRQAVNPVIMHTLRFGPRVAASRCKAAGRMQTAYDPALLYREQDRDAGRMKKLIELPMGEMCLLGGVDQPSVGR